MATLADVKSQFAAQLVAWDLYGCKADWQNKVRAAFRQIGEAVMEENGVDMDEAKNLPPETVLGPKAKAAYQVFCALLQSDLEKDKE